MGKLVSGIRFTADARQGATRYLHAGVEISAPFTESRLILRFPRWVPGSYMIREPVQFLDSITVNDEKGTELKWQRIDVDGLKISIPTDCKKVVIRYRLLATMMSVRANHIDDSHYQKGNMHKKGYSKEQWIDETKNDDLRRLNFLKDKIKNKKILDFGCGNGGFLLLSEKFTDINNGIELEESMFPYFKSKGLQVWKSLDDALIKSEHKYDVITSFHVFEHLSDPIYILSQLSNLLSKRGEIIIEVPNANDALLTFYKNSDFSDFTYWSQHLFLYNEININELVKKAGLKLNWVKQIQRYKLSNHLYWLSNGKPGGHNVWKVLNDIYECVNSAVSKLKVYLKTLSAKLSIFLAIFEKHPNS